MASSLSSSIPKPMFVDATETSILVRNNNNNNETYTLEWKLHPGTAAAAAAQLPWMSTPVSHQTRNDDNDATSTAEDLEPGSTYLLRWTDPTTQQSGPELVIDTEQVGCTPKPDKSGCGGCCVS